MKALALRKKFLAYFQKQEHVAVSSASLIPDNDPSVLLTAAGMQQFKPYFLGQRRPEEDFKSRRLTTVQRCFRTSDIDTVGDDSHLTFFEMLGNFAFGDYGKDAAIRFAWQCLTRTFRVPAGRLWATIFSGDEHSVKDFEAFKVWQAIIPPERIREFGRHENWWGPAGRSGPCGPSSEIHIDLRETPCERKERCAPNCPCGRFLELWNLVFMEHFQDEAGNFRSLPAKNIDTGMGLERLAMVTQKRSSVFATDLFVPIINAIEQEPGFGNGLSQAERNRRLRIIADHIKGAVFLVADGVRFSNKEQGYVLRRVWRRALDQFSTPLASYPGVVDAIINLYHHPYNELGRQRSAIHTILRAETEEYLKHLKTIVERVKTKLRKRRPPAGDNQAPVTATLSPNEAFELFTTYGISLDRLRREGFTFDESAVEKKFAEHRKKSRAGAVKKFGGHGLGYTLDTTKYTPAETARATRLHSATHLLHQALRLVLGNHVRQNGSDISPERLRFDFQHPTKLRPDELRKIEDLVNEQIRRNLSVTRVDMDLEQALQSGALSFFKERYPQRVTVYSIGEFSKEICGGPHVRQASEIGRLKIISEKSSAAGVRRIKAIVEP